MHRLEARLWKPKTLDDIDTDSDEDTRETLTKDPPRNGVLSSCAGSTQEHVISQTSSLETPNRPLVQVDHEIAMEMSKTTPEISAQTRRAYLQVKAQIGHLPGVTDEMIKSEVTKQMVARAMQQAALKVGVKERGADGSRHASQYTASLFDDHCIQQLMERQFLVLEDVMEPATMCELRSEMEDLHAHGALKVTVQQNTGTRDDLITWMDESEAAHAGRRRALPHAIQMLKGVADVLNCGIPNVSLRVPARAMCTCYPGGGAHYKPHRDNTQTPNGGYSNPREITCILYINPDWQEQHGGCLRLHLDADLHCKESRGCPRDCKGKDCHLDIAPQAGRMVIFQSRTVLHEVLPAFKDRMAITLWLFDGNEFDQHETEN